MTAILFQPYVGPSYAMAPVRMLILGESHYGEPHEDAAESTRHVVHMWQSRAWSVRYLTVASRIVTGLRACEVDRDAAFSSLAFYNFVQVCMPDVMVRPTPVQARQSHPAFREMLAVCDPTHVLATGRGFLWHNMPASDGADGTQELGGAPMPYREYGTPSGAARTIALPHLSRASAPRWRAPVADFCRMKPMRKAA